MPCLDDVVLQVLEDLLALIRRVVEEQREELLLDVEHFAHEGDVFNGFHVLHAARFSFASCESFRLVLGVSQPELGTNQIGETQQSKPQRRRL